MPAFLALIIAAGAGCYALAHFLNFGLWNFPLLGALVVAGAVSCGACCGPPRLRFWCGLMRWPLVLGLAILTIVARLSWLTSDEDSNSVMALALGWMTITSVALVGAGKGARRVPCSVPLVPCLSLLGLLCLLSVDTVVQICFMVFVAAGIYLGCYERCLRLSAPQMASSDLKKTSTAARPFLQPATAAPRDGKRGFWLSWLVGGVWFVIVMAGGALFYAPLETYLPDFTALETSSGRSAQTESPSDYSASNAFMELRGGDNLLSERAVMRITTQSGEGTGLWRGRTYERYSRSRWEDREDNPNFIAPRRRWRSVMRERHFDPDRPPLEARWGRRDEVVEQVEVLGDRRNTFYASGEPLSWRAQPLPRQASRAENSASLSRRDDSPSPQWNYEVKSLVVRPTKAGLRALMGYESLPTLAAEPLMASLKVNLQLPRDDKTRVALQTIARQIVEAQPKTPLTPHAKVSAINAYLSRNCVYSLSSPAVPPTQDAATFFLTQSRTGACDMFASSMALLLRSLNVPARLATGYLRTEEPTNSETAVPATASKGHLVRERDAHAWVEYYVPQLGWVAFDPTADTRSLEATSSPSVQLAFSRLNLPIFTLILPATGLVLLFVGALWPFVETRFRAQPLSDDETRLRHQIAASYSQARRDLQRWVLKAPHLTPHEYEALVSRARLPLDAKQEFAALTHLYIAARYGEVPDVTAPEVEGCLQRLRRAIKSRK